MVELLRAPRTCVVHQTLYKLRSNSYLLQVHPQNFGTCKHQSSTYLQNLYHHFTVSTAKDEGGCCFCCGLYCGGSCLSLRWPENGDSTWESSGLQSSSQQVGETDFSDAAEMWWRWILLYYWIPGTNKNFVTIVLQKNLVEKIFANTVKVAISSILTQDKLELYRAHTPRTAASMWESSSSMPCHLQQPVDDL